MNAITTFREMAVRKKYGREPKKHGSGNIWIDAAIEALMQARKEDGSMSVMMVVYSSEKCGIFLEGQTAELTAALIHHAKQDERIAKIIANARDIMEMGTEKFEKFLDMLEDHLDELRRNRPEE